jgi:predicted PurR-regulated permease PerM
MAIASPSRPASIRGHGEGGPGLPVPLLRFAGFVLVVACLYWAQIVLIPVALALLLTFMLAPVVTRLERWRVPRAVAVIAVVLLGLALLLGLGAVVVMQVVNLGEELPKYRENIKEKIGDIRGFGHGSGLERAQETVARAAGEVEREAGRAAPAAKSEKPMPVVIRSDGTPRFTDLFVAVQPWLEPLTRAGFVVLLVPFMLLARQETRNRLIRLIGFGRLAVTTRAMDEAGERVTRYLLTQSFVNTTFGMLVALGLYLIGVPYAVLFGFLAGLLRFVPYVGIWIGAGLPAAMGLAVFPGWGRALMVIALFAALEFFTGGVLEVLLYSRSAGVSEVALLVAIAFWTWAWGPIGLVLATPLTVCIVVVAKYVPELEFLWILMGDEPAVSTDIAVYQRLLAGDEDEASDIVERALEEQPLERVYDAILLPALAKAGRDQARGRISVDEYRYVATELREVVEGLAPAPAEAESESTTTTRVFAAPARNEVDAVGLLMLRDVLLSSRVVLDVASPDMLSAEIVREAREHGADIVVIGAVPPGGLAQARYLCKRLRASVPGVRIVVARLGAVEDIERLREALLSAGADAVGTSVAELRDLIVQLVHIQPEVPSATQPEVASEHVA